MKITITPKDLRIEYFAGSTKGGQHSNKNATCVRVTHVEAGISVECTSYRSQLQNKKEAYRRLLAKLRQHYYVEESKHSGMSSGFGSEDRVRTYNLADHYVVDHRTGERYTLKKDNISDVLEEMIIDTLLHEGSSDED